MKDRLALVAQKRGLLWFCESVGAVVSFHGVFRSLLKLFWEFFEGFVLAELGLAVNLAK